jgi:hypothetical protein
MSISAVTAYVRGLRKYHRLAPHAVVTELGLKAEAYRNGFPYSLLTLKATSVLREEQQTRMRDVIKAFGLCTPGTGSNDATGAPVIAGSAATDDAPIPSNTDGPATDDDNC